MSNLDSAARAARIQQHYAPLHWLVWEKLHKGRTLESLVKEHRYKRRRPQQQQIIVNDQTPTTPTTDAGQASEPAAAAGE